MKFNSIPFKILPSKGDTTDALLWHDNYASIFLGAEPIKKLPSGNEYKRIRIQVIYSKDNLMCDKSYLFILLNQEIVHISEYFITQSDRYSKRTIIKTNKSVTGNFLKTGKIL